MKVEKGYKVKKIEEALEILDEKGDKARVIAGGTDIMVELRNKEIEPKVLIDISNMREIEKIEESEDFIEIGAGVTFTDIINEDLFNDSLFGLKKACLMLGSPQIRNKGTVGGNIINGSSAADVAPPLLCLDSILIFESRAGSREVDLGDFYRNNREVGIGDKEILTKIRFKKPNKNTRLSFAKLGLRKALAIARISNSILLELDGDKKIKDFKLASGALGLYPLREKEVESALIGRKYSNETREEAVELLKESMAKRLEGRSTFPYKKIAVESTFSEAWEGVV